MAREFDPQNLFDRINANRDDHITAEELHKFLADNFVKNVTVEDAQSIINEFDSSADGTMQYFEFQNMVLPAANQSLRDYVVYGRRTYQDPKQPLSVQVSSTFIRILELEIKYAQTLKNLRMELFKNSDFQRNKAFNDASRGLTFINMSDLIYYCEQNGFYPRTDDLEAILRRCDHDADRSLNFEEFCEIVELNPSDQDDPEGQSVNQDAKAFNNSPGKQEI